MKKLFALINAVNVRILKQFNFRELNSIAFIFFQSFYVRTGHKTDLRALRSYGYRHFSEVPYFSYRDYNVKQNRTCGW